MATGTTEIPIAAASFVTVVTIGGTDEFTGFEMAAMLRTVGSISSRISIGSTRHLPPTRHES
jgi:hypothetical protein